MSRHDSAGIGDGFDRNAVGAVIAVVGMVACVALAFLFGQFRIYAPMAREWLCATLTPEFGMGVAFTLICLGLVALVAAWKRP